MNAWLQIIQAAAAWFVPRRIKLAHRRRKKLRAERARVLAALEAARKAFLWLLVLALPLLSGCAAFARNTWRLVVSLALVATLAGGCQSWRDSAWIWVGEQIGQGQEEAAE
jgi:lipopolysaccharide export LptBFGC system permease protein LptF